jgi:hypothetical protein
MTSGTYEGIIGGKNETLKQLLPSKLESGYIILLNRLQKSINYPDILLDNTLINVLPTFHDSAEPVGYKVVNDSKSVVYITDTGYINRKYI